MWVICNVSTILCNLPLNTKPTSYYSKNYRSDSLFTYYYSSAFLLHNFTMEWNNFRRSIFISMQQYFHKLRQKLTRKWSPKMQMHMTINASSKIISPNYAISFKFIQSSSPKRCQNNFVESRHKTDSLKWYGELGKTSKN